MAGEKFTVTLSAKVKDFLASMKKATKAMNVMGQHNRGIIKNFQQMSSSITGGGKKWKKQSQKMKHGLDNVTKSTKKAEKSSKSYFKTLASGAAVMATIVGTLALIKVAYNKAFNASQIQVQAKAFANLTQSYGASSQTLLRELKAASRETLNVVEVMTTASRAILLGISTDKLVDLMKIARAAAKAMGTTVAGAFSDISLGIGRQSRLILDNLGIIVRVGVAYDKYAESVGTTAEALTDYEKRQAFQNAVIKAGENIISRASTGLLDYQDRISRMRVILEEFSFTMDAVFLAAFEELVEFLDRSGLGKKLRDILTIKIPKGIIEHIEKLTTALTKTDGVLNKLNKNIDKEGYKEAGKIAAKEFLLGAFNWLSHIGGALVLPGMGAGILPNLKRAIFGEEPPIPNAARTGSLPRSISGFNANAAGELGGIGGILGASGSGLLDTSPKGKSFLDRVKEIREGLKGGIPTKTPFAQARFQMDQLDEAMKDTALTAQDLASEFEQRFSSIEKNVLSLGPPTKEWGLQIAMLKKQLVEKIRPEAAIEGLGLLSNDRLIKKSTEEIRKFQRVMEMVRAGDLLSSPVEIQKAFKKNFALISEHWDDLTVDLQRDAKEMVEFMRKEAVPNDSIRKGLNQWVDDFNSATDRMAKAGKDLAVGLSSGFETFFFNTMTGKINSLKDAFDSLFKSIARSISKMLADKATQELLSIGGFKGNQTTSNVGLSGSRLGGAIGKGVGFVKGLFSGNAARTGSTPVIPGQMFGASTLGGIGGILASSGSAIGNILKFADGGITSLANSTNSAMVHRSPTLAAIAEKPGKQKEAIMPLEKFTDLVQPVTINISAIDTKSFQQYMSDNKEAVLGTIMSIKGSPAVRGMTPGNRGPF